MSRQHEPSFFDPLGTEELTRIICAQFEEQEPISFDADDPPPEFDGSGLYAIYYLGDSLELYRPLAPYKIPVYVGSAQSHNSATGEGVRQVRPLHTRVKQHWTSVKSGGLPVEEFALRLLLLPDVHIDLGENGLRVGYKPVWNSVLTGFGSNEQGSSTRQSARSKWDTVHPGRRRTFGAELHDRDALMAKVREKIAEQVAEYEQFGGYA